MTHVWRLATLASLALTTAGAEARSPFDGSWVADLDTQSGLPTDVYLVQAGQYGCTSCEPPRRYPADGRLRPVGTAPDKTLEAVSVTGPRTIVTHIVDAMLDRTTTMTVADDDLTATYVSIDYRPGIPRPLRTEYLARRTAPAPPGAHSVSGTWQGVRYVAVAPELRTITLRLTGDRLSYSTPLGVSFDAALGGDFVTVRGPRASDVEVAVRRVDARRIEEHVKRNGKEELLRTFTVSADGSALETASSDLAKGTTFRAISRRQP